MNKSIALIGGGGFIGINLANYFISKDYNVLIINRSEIENKKLISNKIEKKLLDVNKTSKLIDVLTGYENIIWLVNDLVPNTSLDSLVDDFTFNVNPLIKFLETTPKLIFMKRFIFISSGGTIYGDSPEKIYIKEDYSKKPLSAYGLSKIVSEHYIRFITTKSSFESIILRPSNVYGKFQSLKKTQGIVGYAFDALVNNKPIDLYNDGKAIRDFIHVYDFAEAINCCIETKFEGSRVETYNVGSQIGYSISEVIDLINHISGGRIETLSKPARAVDVNFNVLDIEKIKSQLGWKPKITIEEGLNQVWQWVQSEKKGNI